MNKNPFYWLVLVLCSAVLSACNTTSVQPSAQYSANAKWILMPIVNYSQTPQAGQKAERILASLLHQKGITGLNEYPVSTDTSGMLALDDSARFEQAAKWAKNEEFQYWVSGSVEEWRYKSGLDGEPAVSITLRIVNPKTQQVMWTVTGAKTGWGQESVASIANELLTELLTGLMLN